MLGLLLASNLTAPPSPVPTAAVATQAVSPPIRYATFTSASPHAELASPNRQEVVLGGGQYEIRYEVPGTWGRQYYNLPGNLFVADFVSGTNSGTLSNADTIVLIGDVNVEISAIGGSAMLHAAIFDRRNEQSAYFKYSATPKPSASLIKKQIIVVGKVAHWHLPSTFHMSRLKVNLYLDLDSTAEEAQREARREAEAKAAAEVYALRLKQQTSATEVQRAQRRTTAKGR